MKKQYYIMMWLTGGSLCLAFGARAQTGSGVAVDVKSLHAVLEQLYADMLPLCGKLIGVGRALAGFAATWYIAARVWSSIARAEPIDLYPLLRPFALGFAVMIFPSVIAMINAVMQPAVSGTQAMVSDSNEAIARLLQIKEAAIEKTSYWQMYVGPDGNGDRDKWYRYTYGDESESWMESISNDLKFAFARFSYNFRNGVKQWMSEVLEILFEGASLCIDTIRTFYLLVLAILGPLVFGIAVFDGFQHTLTAWLARYINVFLWLPVANIFGAVMGKIQENMLQIDVQQIASRGDTFFSTTDTAYLVFMLIGIVGYFTVPSVANYIVHAGGGNTLLQKFSSGIRTGSQVLLHHATTTSGGRGGAAVSVPTSYPENSSGFLEQKITGKS